MVCDVCRAAGETARAKRIVEIQDQEFVFSTESGRELSILAGRLFEELSTILHSTCAGCDCQHETEQGVFVE